MILPKLPKRLLTPFSLVLVVVVCLTPTEAVSNDQPNVVIILADDMGWGDPSCYNPASKIKTPHIDRLAKDGMRFTDAHTPSAVCTPTRYGLLTGRYCWRTRLQSGVLDGFSPPLIEDDRLTLASMLQRAGYATACIGKWHLGMTWTRADGSTENQDRGQQRGFRPGYDIDFSKPLRGGPLAVGFDHFFGIAASLDMPPYCWIQDDRCTPVPTVRVPTAKDTIFLNQAEGVAARDFRLEDVLPTLRQRAIRWIDGHVAKHDRSPFFLYLPLTSPHLPVAPSKAFEGKSDVGLYGDFVVETDACVGAIVETLKRHAIDRNTIILFTSDNGGLWHGWDATETDDVQGYRPTSRAEYTRRFGHQSNGPLRGTKADIWEGGHRVPMIVRWPEKTPADSQCDHLVELTDVFATVADVIGQQIPPTAAQDSRSFASLLEGAAGKQATRAFSIHHSLRGHFAIRQGSWKLIPLRGSGGFSVPRTVDAKADEPRGQLYDLQQDPSETRNLWSEKPQVVERLQVTLDDAMLSTRRNRIAFTSSADGSQQQAYVIEPPPRADESVRLPLVVSLHSWSANMEQRNRPLERLVHEAGWYYLFPNFRGPNSTPQACGSSLAQQDVLDAIQWVTEHYPVDSDRIFLTGDSGGGHMTMLMAARYPRRWRAASAWVGISDLAAWHAKHQGSKYGAMMRKACGGAPGDSEEVDRQYHERSPLSYLAAAKDVAIDIAAGIHDGHKGSVPIRHSLEAFNAIAAANGAAEIQEHEIVELSQPAGRLLKPQDSDVGHDDSFGRDYYLRRFAGRARITIFEGGHEGIASATMAWFKDHLD